MNTEGGFGLKEEFGPFHREASPTQTFADALVQRDSREVWGKAGKIGGLFPCVKAYNGPICFPLAEKIDCKDVEGIEFMTGVKPTETPPANLAFVRWHTQTDNAKNGFRMVDVETVAIQARLTKIHYGIDKDWVDDG